MGVISALEVTESTHRGKVPGDDAETGKEQSKAQSSGEHRTLKAQTHTGESVKDLRRNDLSSKKNQVTYDKEVGTKKIKSSSFPIQRYTKRENRMNSYRSLRHSFLS